MARKATDLLDVFRFNSEDGNDDHERKKRRKDARATARASRSGKGGGRKRKKGAGSRGRKPEGIQLTQRHLVLASCAILLLLVLSFTLGIAAGRPDGAQREATTLQRETQVAIRASLPLVDPASRKQLDPARIRRKLQHEYRLQAGNLRIWKEGARVILEVGPFATRARAEAFLRSSGLEMAHISMEDPFRWPDYVPWKP